MGGLFTPAAVGAVFWGRWKGLGLRFSGSCWENGESVTVLLGLNAGFWDRMGSLGRLALRICYSRVFALVLDTKKYLRRCSKDVGLAITNPGLSVPFSTCYTVERLP